MSRGHTVGRGRAGWPRAKSMPLATWLHLVKSRAAPSVALSVVLECSVPVLSKVAATSCMWLLRSQDVADGTEGLPTLGGKAAHSISRVGL